MPAYDFAHAGGMSTYTQPGHIPLFYEDVERVTEKGTIIAGGSGLTFFVRGTLMGRVGNTSNWTMALAAAGDGSQTPRAVLAHDVDLTATNHEGLLYKSGVFNEKAVTLGTGITLDTPTRDAMRLFDLYFKAGINP